MWLCWSESTKKKSAYRHYIPLLNMSCSSPKLSVAVTGSHVTTEPLGFVPSMNDECVPLGILVNSGAIRSSKM